MLNRRYNIAPRVLIQEQRGRYTSPPLEKVELDAAVSAAKLTGIRNLLERYADDAVRFALDELSASL
jgi:hypothetical protein